MISLQSNLDKLKQKIEGSMPPDVIQIMHQATKELESSGIGETIVKEGMQAPIFTLNDQDGNSFSSDQALAKGPLVLTFYRGVWCPYCNLDLGYLKRYQKEIDEYGASMVSISPQLPKFNEEIIEQQRLPFSLLSDKGNEVASQFGLRWAMKDPLLSLYRDQFKISLPEYNGDDSWTLPIPARFVIDSEGAIRYAEYSIDYTKRPNPDALLAVLKGL